MSGGTFDRGDKIHYDTRGTIYIVPRGVQMRSSYSSIMTAESVITIVSIRSTTEMQCFIASIQLDYCYLLKFVE